MARLMFHDCRLRGATRCANLLPETGSDERMDVTPLSLTFRRLAGYGHGLRQTIMQGRIVLPESAEAGLKQTVALVKRVIADQTYADVQDDQAEACGIENVLFLYFQLQQRARIPVFDEVAYLDRQQHSDSSSGGATGTVHELVIPYWNVVASRIVFHWIAEAVGSPSLCPADVEELYKKLRVYSLGGTNAYPFAKAAWQLNLPIIRVHDRTLQFGVGSQSRWLDSSLSDADSAIAVRLAKLKPATNQVLHRLGFPVPRQVVVTTLEAALAVRDQLSPPLVTKPAEQDQGRGVSVGLDTEDQIREGFGVASRFGKAVIVEEYVAGVDYRLTVFRDEIVKVMKREPLSVRGDGVSSIAALLEAKSRLQQHAQNVILSGKNPFVMDEEVVRVLNEQDLEPSYVPSPDQEIVLRKIANISAGGRQELIPIASVHPDNQRLAVEAVRALRLELCGLDLIMEDISISWRHVGCKIIELNAQPQIGVNLAPETYALILKRLVSGASPQIMLLVPPVGVTMPTPQNQIVKNLLKGHASPQVVASSRQLWHDEALVLETETDGTAMIMAALQNVRAETLLFILDADSILRNGLPTHRLDAIHLAIEKALDPEHQRRQAELKAIFAETPLRTFVWPADE